jgi:hypothetical protein
MVMVRLPLAVQATWVKTSDEMHLLPVPSLHPDVVQSQHNVTVLHIHPLLHGVHER